MKKKYSIFILIVISALTTNVIGVTLSSFRWYTDLSKLYKDGIIIILNTCLIMLLYKLFSFKKKNDER